MTTERTADDVIADVRSKARGRTRYEGQPPYDDELLVERIDELESKLKDWEELSKAVRKANGEIQYEPYKPSPDAVVVEGFVVPEDLKGYSETGLREFEVEKTKGWPSSRLYRILLQPKKEPDDAQDDDA